MAAIPPNMMTASPQQILNQFQFPSRSGLGLPPAAPAQPASALFPTTIDPVTQGLLGAAAAFGQAAQPSLVPQPLGAMLAPALSAGLGGYQAGVKQQQAQQLANLKRTQALQKAQVRSQLSPNAQALYDLGVLPEVLKEQFKYRNTSTLISPARAKSLNLPTNTGQVYQINAEGRISQVGGGGTTVNVGGEKANALFIDPIKDAREAAARARNTSGLVTTMTDLLDRGVQTGFGAEMLMEINRIGQIFDPNYKASKVAGAEAFVGLSNQVILPLVKMLGVNPTDKDLTFIVKGSPTLSKSPRGNRLLLKVLDVANRRTIRYAELMDDWAAENAEKISSGELTPFAASIAQSRHMREVMKTDPLFNQTTKELRAEFDAIVGGGSGAGSSARNATRQRFGGGG